MRRAWWLPALLACMLGSADARADAAAAEALFRDGRRLMDEGRINEACEKLQESQAQDPSSGTLLNLALCREKQGRVASAWADYLSAARLARTQGKPDRATTAESKAAALEAILPRVLVRASSQIELRLVCGDKQLGRGIIGTAVPVDPGTCSVAASAPGMRTWSTTITVREKETTTVDVPPLEPEAAPPASASAPASSAPAPAPPMVSSAPPVRPAPSAGVAVRSSSSPMGWILGAVGVAALGAGAAFGASSLASYREAERLCPSHRGCSDDAIASRDSAETKAWLTNVALGVGVIGVGVGAYLLLRKPAAEPHVSIGMAPAHGGAVASLLGRF